MVMVMLFFSWFICVVVGIGVFGYEIYDDCLVGYMLMCFSDGFDGCQFLDYDCCFCCIDNGLICYSLCGDRVDCS